MVLGMFTDLCTLGFVLYHTYIHFKIKKTREFRLKSTLSQQEADSSTHTCVTADTTISKSNVNSSYLRNYPYIFILIAIILAFEQTFSIVKLLPFYSLVKLLLVLVICVPGTRMANRLYKEYIATFFERNEDKIDFRLRELKIILQNFFSSACISAFSVIRDRDQRIANRLIKMNVIGDSNTKMVKEE